MSKNSNHLKYYCNDLIPKQKRASLNQLIILLENKPLTRKEIREKTNWTICQTGNLIYTGQKKGFLKIKDKKVYLTKK